MFCLQVIDVGRQEAIQQGRCSRTQRRAIVLDQNQQINQAIRGFMLAPTRSVEGDAEHAFAMVLLDTIAKTVQPLG